MAFIMSWQADEDGADRGMARLAGFRDGVYCSLGMRRDALLEACDALACQPERVHMLAELCLEPECRRGHGGVCDASGGALILADRAYRGEQEGGLAIPVVAARTADTETRAGVTSGRRPAPTHPRGGVRLTAEAHRRRHDIAGLTAGPRSVRDENPWFRTDRGFTDQRQRHGN